MFYLFVAAGLFLLLAGGDALVRGAVGLAKLLGVSPLVISLTIVAYGTSAPELLVSLDAFLSGAPDIAVGNVVGSNIANILLIVSCGALISPMTWQRGAMRVDNTVMLAASAALVLLGLGSGLLTVWSGSAMLALLAAYTVWQYRAARRWRSRPDGGTGLRTGECTPAKAKTTSLWRPLLTLLCGLIGVSAGSHLLVTGAVGLAQNFGIPEATIGLTLVAVGTSLPELATTLVAACRRHADVALGNVVGSNIFNILGILGLVPVFGTLRIPESMIAVDLWVMLGTTVLFVAWMTARRSFGRGLGALSLIAYAAYILYQYSGAPNIPITPVN
ncbi:MAG TPA: calcium/sodium antiporter [Kiloniellales bacterium]|jgi:cation:H+ antiporter